SLIYNPIGKDDPREIQRGFYHFYLLHGSLIPAESQNKGGNIAFYFFVPRGKDNFIMILGLKIFHTKVRVLEEISLYAVYNQLVQFLEQGAVSHVYIAFV